MTVITISRQYRSGGDQIANRLCQLLGLRAFDKRLIAQAALEAGLSHEEVINFHEEDRKLAGFFDRLFGWHELPALARAWQDGTEGERSLEEIDLEEKDVVALVEKAIRSAYQAGGMIIVGRGGQMILQGCPDVIHVRVEAPMEDRIQRVKMELKAQRGEYYADIDVRRDAQDLLERKDAASQDYIQRYYGQDWNNPLLYHLVINTGRLGIQRAAELIADVARTYQPVEKLPEQPLPEV